MLILSTKPRLYDLGDNRNETVQDVFTLIKNKLVSALLSRGEEFTPLDGILFEIIGNKLDGVDADGDRIAKVCMSAIYRSHDEGDPARNNDDNKRRTWWLLNIDKLIDALTSDSPFARHRAKLALTDWGYEVR